MGRSDLLGPFELAVLAAVVRAGRNAYGIPVHADVVERTGRPTQLGAVYGTLNRLKAKGFVGDRMADPDESRGGRRRRYFEATGSGLAAIVRTRNIHRASLAGISLPAMEGA